jgi:hypothetical protein
MTKRAKEIVPVLGQFEPNGFYERLLAARQSDRRAFAAISPASKLASVPSYVWDAGAGCDFKGERFDPASGALERLAPMLAGDAMDAYKLEGAAGLWKAIPSFFGIGSSTYEKKQRKGSDR